MKDSVITSLELDVKIRKIISSSFKAVEEEKYLQKASLASDLASLDELPVGVNFQSKKYKKLLSYLIVYYYFPLERSVFCYMHLDLEDLLSKTESYWLTVLLEDQALFLKYLELQETMTEQQFFSGICNKKNILETLALCHLRFEEKLRRPKKLVRRKGYRDKGSLGTISNSVLKKEMKNDFYLTIIQLQKEEREILKSESCTLLREYLSEGRVLTDESLVEFKLKKGNKENERNRSTAEEDYCKQRSNETNIRKERKNQQAAEQLRIQNL